MIYITITIDFFIPQEQTPGETDRDNTGVFVKSEIGLTQYDIYIYIYIYVLQLQITHIRKTICEFGRGNSYPGLDY